ncbi:MAG: hypothetical protein ACHQRM_03645 [Bacteroidia bacterium]
MKNRFTAVFSVFLLLVFTFNLVIYYTVFEVSDSEAKSEMNTIISGIHSLEGTQCFTLPLSRFNDTQRKEIWLDGKLYDIVKAEKGPDAVLIYVLNDKKEEGIVNDFRTHTEGQTDITVNSGSRHNKSHSKAPVPQKYFPSATLITVHVDSAHKSIFFRIDCFYAGILPEAVAPPPEPLS